MRTTIFVSALVFLVGCGTDQTDPEFTLPQSTDISEPAQFASSNSCSASPFFGGNGTRIRIIKNPDTKKQDSYLFVAKKNGFLDGPWHHNGRWEVENDLNSDDSTIKIRAGANRQKNNDFEVQLQTSTSDPSLEPGQAMATITGTVDRDSIGTSHSLILGAGTKADPYCIEFGCSSKDCLEPDAEAIRICWYCK